MPVDHAHICEVEFLPPEPGRPEGLDRLLDGRAEPLERRSDSDWELRQPTLDALARVPQLRVEADPVEVARQRTDVRRDRHSVVVEQDDDRCPLATRLVHGLKRDAARHGSVADDGHDVGILRMPTAHRLLDPDRVADRRRSVARPHDVVFGLLDRAERRQSLVLADRVQPVAASGEDLVRICLVPDVPHDLVPW